MRLFTLLFIGLLVAGLPSVVAARNMLDRTIAKLNEDILTESDLARVISESQGSLAPAPSQALEIATPDIVLALFDRTVLLQAAKKQKIQVPDSELQQQVQSMVAEIRAKFASEKEFRQALALDQMNLQDLEAELTKRARTDYQIYHLVTRRFSVADSEAREWEAQNVNGTSSTSLRLRRLAVPVKGKGAADQARNEVRFLASRIFTEGLTFEEGVRKYSRAPGAQEDGGDLGYLSLDKLAPEVARATKDLKPGQASVPVVAGGYASIFYIEGRHGAKSALLEQRFTATREKLIQELRRKANVQVFDERLQRLVPQEYGAR